MPDHIKKQTLNQILLEACEAALEDGSEYKLSETVKQQLRNAIQSANNPIKKIHWMAGEVCFDCICGIEEIVISEGGECYTCECGRIYEVVHRIETR